jgi:hypothetical protein
LEGEGTEASSQRLVRVQSRHDDSSSVGQN